MPGPQRARPAGPEHAHFRSYKMENDYVKITQENLSTDASPGRQTGGLIYRPSRSGSCSTAIRALSRSQPIRLSCGHQDRRAKRLASQRLADCGLTSSPTRTVERAPTASFAGSSRPVKADVGRGARRRFAADPADGSVA